MNNLFGTVDVIKHQKTLSNVVWGLARQYLPISQKIYCNHILYIIIFVNYTNADIFTYINYMGRNLLYPVLAEQKRSYKFIY